MALAVAFPVLAGYYLAFMPEKRKEVFTLLKVFALPLLVLLATFIIGYKYYQRGDKTAGIILISSWVFNRFGYLY